MGWRWVACDCDTMPNTLHLQPVGSERAAWPPPPRRFRAPTAASTSSPCFPSSLFSWFRPSTSPSRYSWAPPRYTTSSPRSRPCKRSKPIRSTASRPATVSGYDGPRGRESDGDCDDWEDSQSCTHAESRRVHSTASRTSWCGLWHVGGRNWEPWTVASLFHAC
jgi:hypothetical protein